MKLTLSCWKSIVTKGEEKDILGGIESPFEDGDYEIRTGRVIKW